MGVIVRQKGEKRGRFYFLDVQGTLGTLLPRLHYTPNVRCQAALGL
jgi:hypothetical protein